jgi:ATP-dependent RNA helicase DeaD
VGAIANEVELDSEYIGRIEIFEDYSTVDLPEGMPKELFKHLRGVWVSGQRLDITRLTTKAKEPAEVGDDDKPKSNKKPRSAKKPKSDKKQT